MLLFYFTYHFCRRAGHHRVGGDILGNHRACGDDGVLADGDTGQNLDIGTQPGTSADDDGLGEQLVTLGGVLGVVLGGQHAVGADEGAVADGDATDGEEGASEVEEAVAPEGDAGAVVDVERSEYAHVVGHLAAGDRAQAVAHLGLGVVAVVHLGAQAQGALHVGIEGVAADIVFSGRIHGFIV